MNRVTNQDHYGRKQGFHQYATELTSLPSHYEKSINFDLQKFIGKSQKLLLNQNNLSPCLTFSLLHCSHVTCLTHQTLTTNLVSWYVITSLCHSCYISEYVYLHIFRVNFSRGTSFLAIESYAWNGLITNDSVD